MHLVLDVELTRSDKRGVPGQRVAFAGMGMEEKSELQAQIIISLAHLLVRHAA